MGDGRSGREGSCFPWGHCAAVPTPQGNRMGSLALPSMAEVSTGAVLMAGPPMDLPEPGL